MSRRAPQVLESTSGLELAPDPLRVGHDLACPACQMVMEIHQPDLDQPERLLGTCTTCRAWTLVDVGSYGQLTLTMLARPARSR
jgi:hypothetical protein